MNKRSNNLKKNNRRNKKDKKNNILYLILKDCYTAESISLLLILFSIIIAMNLYINRNNIVNHIIHRYFILPFGIFSIYIPILMILISLMLLKKYYFLVDKYIFITALIIILDNILSLISPGIGGSFGTLISSLYFIFVYKIIYISILIIIFIFLLLYLITNTIYPSLNIRKLVLLFKANNNPINNRYEDKSKIDDKEDIIKIKNNDETKIIDSVEDITSKIHTIPLGDIDDSRIIDASIIDKTLLITPTKKKDSRDIIYPDIDKVLIDSNSSQDSYNNSEKLLSLTIDKLNKLFNRFELDISVDKYHIKANVILIELIASEKTNIKKIKDLHSNISYTIGVNDLRIIAPLYGKSVIGLEFSNKYRSIITLKSRVKIFKNKDDSNKYYLPIFIGETLMRKAYIFDLLSTPHLLIAGATGMGKSICINVILASILLLRSPELVRLILIDVKKVELSLYSSIPHLLFPVIYERSTTFNVLKWLVAEMDKRYDILLHHGFRDGHSFNKAIDEGKILNSNKMQYIVLVIDEFADLMMTSSKEIEPLIIRLAQLARAALIHLTLATQRPSASIITGNIKANIPSRIAFKTSSAIDSRIILDSSGAEKLKGKGDGILSIQGKELERFQCSYISDIEVKNIVKFWSNYNVNYERMDIEKIDNQNHNNEDFKLIESTLNILFTKGYLSASLIQRELSISFNRATKIVSLIEDNGIIANQNNKKFKTLIDKNLSYNEVLMKFK